MVETFSMRKTAHQRTALLNCPRRPELLNRPTPRELVRWEHQLPKNALLQRPAIEGFCIFKCIYPTKVRFRTGDKRAPLFPPPLLLCDMKLCTVKNGQAACDNLQWIVVTIVAGWPVVKRSMENYACAFCIVG